ncbi:MAG: hypothetical protein R3B70_21420 [Polyangiaceae bacterium]
MQQPGQSGNSAGNGGNGQGGGNGAGDIGGDFTVGSGGQHRRQLRPDRRRRRRQRRLHGRRRLQRVRPQREPRRRRGLRLPDANGNTPTPADEDCDGVVDSNVVANCDEGLALGDTNPMSGAKAIELCQTATAGDKGGASWRRNTSAPTAPRARAGPAQWGIKSKFGQNVNPQSGKSMLVLSAGYARDASDPGACNDTSCQSNLGGTAPRLPAGRPQLRRRHGHQRRRRPRAQDPRSTNATGYKFNFKFYSFEFPEWICLLQ